MNGNWGLIDLETPDYAKTRKSFMDDTQELVLVWSDEFNVDGRTFYPGDDPYWEAVDLHYWQTNNLEWYDPAAVTTKDGALEITLSAKETHDLNYQGGMIQTWNKFCFTGGIVETAVTLPGTNNIVGLWPAVWTMGNLGRAGFGASLEGMVRISYFDPLLCLPAEQRMPYSGRTHMIVVMLVQWRISPLMGSLLPPWRTVMLAMEAFCRSFLVSASRAAHAQANHTQVPCTRMERMSEGRLLKSIFSRLRYVIPLSTSLLMADWFLVSRLRELHSLARSPNLDSLRYVS